MKIVHGARREGLVQVNAGDIYIYG